MKTTEFNSILIALSLTIFPPMEQVQASETIKTYLQTFPYRVLALAKCDLSKLKCGQVKLSIRTESNDDRYGEARIYRDVSSNELDMSYYFPKKSSNDIFIHYMTIKNSNIKVPLGIAVGDSIQKVEKLLGHGYRESEEQSTLFTGRLSYSHKELEDGLIFILDKDHVSQIVWETYID